MTIKISGIDINRDGQFDSGPKKPIPAICPACSHEQVMMQLTIAADLSCTGKEYKKKCP